MPRDSDTADPAREHRRAVLAPAWEVLDRLPEPEDGVVARVLARVFAEILTWREPTEENTPQGRGEDHGDVTISRTTEGEAAA